MKPYNKMPITVDKDKYRCLENWNILSTYLNSLLFFCSWLIINILLAYYANLNLISFWDGSQWDLVMRSRNSRYFKDYKKEIGL